jgi:ribosomal protein S18 acetylase RimI-like enzyme
LNRDCSLIVRDRENKPVSVLLAYRDVYHELYAAGKTTDPDHLKKRLFIKTIATHPDYQGKQIGTLLVNLTQNLAKEAGYEEIYHMLMYKDNLSATKGKEKFVTKKVREYALMEKTL